MCEEKKYLCHVENCLCTRTKFFFYAYKKNALFWRLHTDDDTKERKESKLQQKVALCHYEVNTKVSSCQNTRTEGKAKDSRTKPDVFPMYHYVTTNLNPNNLSTETCGNIDNFEFGFDFYS